MATEFLDTVYRVLGEAKLKSSFLSVGGAADALEDKLQGINGALGAVGLGAGLVGLNLFSNKISELGQNLGESENLVAESFDGMTASANAWSENLQKTLGLNAADARRQAATFNVMFNSMELGEQKSYDLATSLTKLAYDMSSFRNMSPEEAFEKLRAGITGEAEPLKALGILLTEETVKQYAYANGIAKSGEQLTEQQKVLARYGLILQQTSKDQGDLERTMDSGANVTRRLNTQLGITMTTMGEGAAEMREKWQSAIIPIVESLNESNPELLKFAGGFVEVATQAGNVIAPIWGLTNAVMAMRNAKNLATIAQHAETGAEAAKIPVAHAEAAALTEVAAANTAAATSAGGLYAALLPVIAVALAAAAAYAVYKSATEWTPDAVSKSDEEMDKKGGIQKWQKDRSQGAVASWFGEVTTGTGSNIAAGEEADKKIAEINKQRAAKQKTLVEKGRTGQGARSDDERVAAAWAYHNSAEYQASQAPQKTKGKATARGNKVKVEFDPVEFDAGAGGDYDDDMVATSYD